MTSALHDYIKREGIVNSVSIKLWGPGVGSMILFWCSGGQRKPFWDAGCGWAELFTAVAVTWVGFSHSALVDVVFTY